jgi:integrase
VSERIDRYLARLTGGGLISPVDAALLKDYLLHSVNERGITEQTALTRCRYIAIFMRGVKDNLTSDNSVETVPGWDTLPLEYSHNVITSVFAAWRKKYKPNTFNNMVFVTRKFLEWGRREAPKVQPEKKGKMTKTAAMMLTQEEVQRMIEVAWTSRNRAIISLLYESGMRPIELVRLTWGEVKFDDYGAVINTSEKTAPALAAWKADHPNPDSQARVFLKAREWRGSYCYLKLFIFFPHFGLHDHFHASFPFVRLDK